MRDFNLAIFTTILAGCSGGFKATNLAALDIAVTPQSFQYKICGTLATSEIKSEIGNAYWILSFAADGGDTSQAQAQSDLMLFENGTQIGPAHSAHQSIRDSGGGTFSFWNYIYHSLYFSSSDNTDPRTNGRIYTYGVPLNSNCPIRIPASAPWPLLYAQSGGAGADSVDAINDMASSGSHLMLESSPITGALLDAADADHVMYIDRVIWNDIFFGLCSYDAAGVAQCTDTPQQEQQILAAVQQHLQDVANSTNLAGFWILDDGPPGVNLQALLGKVHALVSAANQTSAFPRPTICGLGGGIYADSAMTMSHALDSFINYNPSACDIVTLYYYAYDSSIDPSTVDWSMSSLLPYLLKALTDRGWNSATQPLFGMPQAFADGPNGAWVIPNADAVAAQTAAYCQAGASGILAFSWYFQGGFNAGGGASQQISNTPVFKQGVLNGLAQCKTYW